MTTPLTLRLIEPVETSENLEPAQSTNSKIFIRTLSVPPGAPWEQSRAARLDTRLGAPLPIGELVWRLQRLTPWRPGASSRWAVFYARIQDVGDRLSAALEVEGRPFRVTFVPLAEQARAARRGIFVALGVGVACVMVVAAVLSALAARSAANDRLETVEQLAALHLGEAQKEARIRDQERALDAEGMRGRSLDTFLRDLAWVSTAKAPNARIQALHWDHGYTAVEVRGDEEPFTRVDRGVRRSNKVLGRDVRLWGVDADKIAADASVRP